jgi:hypothetical protein
VAGASCFFSIALNCENPSPFEKSAIFCVNLGFHETSLGPRQLSRGALDITLRKDSCLWEFLLSSYIPKVLKSNYANAFLLFINLGGHWGPWMVVRTNWNYGGLRGAWQTVGAVGVHRGLKRARDSCRGFNEAAGGYKYQHCHL